MSDRVRFCGQCGTEVPESDLFCGSCGHELGRQKAGRAPASDKSRASETPIDKSSSKGGKRPWYKRRAIIIPLLALFILVGVFTDPEDDSDTAAPATTLAPTTTAASTTTATAATTTVTATTIESPTTVSTSPATSMEPVSPSPRCLADINAAASISEFADTAADLDPTFTSCTSVEEWQTAAIAAGLTERIDIAAWIPTRCEYEQHLKSTPLCRAYASDEDSPSSP